MKYLILIIFLTGCSAPTPESLELKIEDEYRNKEVCDIIYQWKLEEISVKKKECEKRVRENIAECEKVISRASVKEKKYMSCSNYKLEYCDYDLMKLGDFMARCYGRIRGL